MRLPSGEGASRSTAWASPVASAARPDRRSCGRGPGPDRRHSAGGESCRRIALEEEEALASMPGRQWCPRGQASISWMRASNGSRPGTWPGRRWWRSAFAFVHLPPPGSSGPRSGGIRNRPHGTLKCVPSTASVAAGREPRRRRRWRRGRRGEQGGGGKRLARFTGDPRGVRPKSRSLTRQVHWARVSARPASSFRRASRRDVPRPSSPSLGGG